MKRAYALVFALIICIALVSGCTSQAEPSQKNATAGYKFYDFNKAHTWKMNITMYASGVNSTWDMIVHQENETVDGSILRHFQIDTIGNGMNITYDVWSNATTYEVTRMHAKGYTGDYYEDRDTSKQQVYTLPDFGLSYYFVPFLPIRQINVVSPDGRIAPATIYAATDNKGFTVAYWINPSLPVPIKVEATDKNFKITSMLVEYS